MRPNALLIHGDARHLPLRDESVQCVVTSPPYWGLRDYGLEPLVWGGEAVCEHKWASEQVATFGSKGNWQAAFGGATGQNRFGYGNVDAAREQKDQIAERAFCLRCSAWCGSLGLEPTPDLYIQHLVEIFREVRRVLRKDGTCWVNMGDSYVSAQGGRQMHAGELPSTFRHDRPDPKQRDDVDVMGWSERAVAPRMYPARETGLKPKDLVGMSWRLAFALQADGWWLRSDVVWCLSGGTRVYARTQKGEMPMTIKDLARLDPKTVKLWNGEKWSQLLGVSMSGRKDDEIEFTLRSGERVSCTPTHKWPTKRGIIEAKDITLGDVILGTKLPEPEFPTSPRYIPDEVGWFVGLYLAEGSRDTSGTIQISSHAMEEGRFQRLNEIAWKFGALCRVHRLDGNSAVACIDSPILSAIIDTYLAGRTAHDKHLTNACWRRSDQFLTDLLGGYLEGDGHYDRKNDRWRLGFTRNYSLEADLRTLCGRLDLPLTLNLSTATIGEKEYQAFRGEIRFSRGVHVNCKERGEVVIIAKSRARQFYDLGMEDDPHLFALASGTLTHNSKPNPMPESVTDRPTKAHEYVFLLTKSERYFYDQEAVKEESATQDPRRPYTSEGAWQMDGRPKEQRHGGELRKQDALGKATYTGINDRYRENPVLGRNLRSVWTIATEPFPDAHFATFPSKLVETCVKAGTSEKGACAECGAPWERVLERTHYGSRAGDGDPAVEGFTRNRMGGQKFWDEEYEPPRSAGWKPTCDCGIGETNPCVILDPFCGSGTVPMVTQELGRVGIGVDLKASYLEMAKKRTAQGMMF